MMDLRWVARADENEGGNCGRAVRLGILHQCIQPAWPIAEIIVAEDDVFRFDTIKSDVPGLIGKHEILALDKLERPLGTQCKELSPNILRRATIDDNNRHIFIYRIEQRS